MATNLQFIKSGTVTSGTTTINITDCFSSAYNVYKVTLNGFYASGIDYFYLRLIDSGGSVISASDYDLASFEMKSNTTFVERYATNYSAMVPSTNYLPDSIAESYNGVFYFYNPASASSYTFMQGQSSQMEYGNNYVNKYIGILKQSASMTGFQWSVGTLSKTFQGGEINVYGVK